MDTENKNQKAPLFIVILLIAFGLVIFLSGFDIGPLNKRDINGPPWIGMSAGLCFILTGLAMFTKNISWLNQLFGLLILFTFAIIGNWIGFGAGERVCTGESFLFFDIGEMNGLMCRIPFAYGAILVDAIIVYVILSKVQKKLISKMKWPGELAKWILIIVLLPILIPLFLTLIVQAGFGAIKRKF